MILHGVEGDDSPPPPPPPWWNFLPPPSESPLPPCVVFLIMLIYLLIKMMVNSLFAPQATTLDSRSPTSSGGVAECVRCSFSLSLSLGLSLSHARTLLNVLLHPSVLFFEYYLPVFHARQRMRNRHPQLPLTGLRVCKFAHCNHFICPVFFLLLLSFDC